MSEAEFVSYVDANTSYTSGQTVDDKIPTLDSYSVRLFKWFSSNHMKVNKDKCDLLSNKERVTTKMGETEIKSSNCEKVLGIKVDEKLTFNEHLCYIIDKASCKINALSRVELYMNKKQEMHSNELILLVTF